jgi:hypothetical protein
VAVEREGTVAVAVAEAVRVGLEVAVEVAVLVAPAGVGLSVETAGDSGTVGMLLAVQPKVKKTGAVKRHSVGKRRPVPGCFRIDRTSIS